MSIIVSTAVSTALAPIIASSLAAASLGAGYLGRKKRTLDNRKVDLNSNISEDFLALVDIALERIEVVYNIPVSKWNTSFLDVKPLDGKIAFEIPLLSLTTLKTEEDALTFLNLLSQEIYKLVQGNIYADIQNKAESKGLILEDETVEEDDTIVLTFRI